MKCVSVALMVASVALASACSGPHVLAVQTHRPSAGAPVLSAASIPAGAVSTPRLVFVLTAPQVKLAWLPMGTTLKASDYKVLLTGDHVVSAKYYEGNTRGGGGVPLGWLELALDATGTSTMAKWGRDHPQSAKTALVDGRVLAQSILAKHIENGKLSLVATGPGATTMGQLVASAIRTTR
jgi:hypothetical protein